MRRVATAILIAMALIVWQPEGPGLVTELRAQEPVKLSRHAEKIKDTIGSLGTGNEARVLVELRDKTKLAGYVKSMQLDEFELFDTVADTAKGIKYEEVKKIKALGSAWVQGQSSGRRSGQRPLIGKAAIVVAVVLVVVVVALVASDRS